MPTGLAIRMGDENNQLCGNLARREAQRLVAYWRNFGEAGSEQRGEKVKPLKSWRSLGDSNPCFRRERAIA